MPRTLTPELMDDPNVPEHDLDQSLRYIRWVNRWLGGRAALLRHLRRWSRNWPIDRPITLLDIGTGSADLPLAARRWAACRGFDLRITAADLHETTLALADRYLNQHANREDRAAITLVRCNALDLTGRFTPGSFDYTHAGLFLHHLPHLDVLTVLRIMDRLASAGLVWNDLVRSRPAAAALNVFLLGQPPMVRHDARVSFQAGFTRREVEDFARRLDLAYTRYHPGPLLHRFTLAGEKPGAW